MIIHRIRKYFRINREFRRIVKNMIQINGKDVKCLHINHWFGFVVNISKLIESKFSKDELSTIHYLKGTDIAVCLNSNKSQDYYIEFKDKKSDE